MSSKVSKLVSTYRDHLSVPWQAGLTAITFTACHMYCRRVDALMPLKASLALCMNG